MLVEAAPTALPSLPDATTTEECNAWPSASSPATETVNPLFELAERSEAEHVGIHVYKVAKDQVVVEAGEPANFLHPLSWTTPRPTPPTTPTALPAGHSIPPHHDSTEKQSHTDQLRIAKQELRQDLGQYSIKSHSSSAKGKGRAVQDDSPMEELSRENLTAAANSIASPNGDSAIQSPLHAQATPPPTPPKDSHSLPTDQTPVLNTPGFVVPNSRSLPSTQHASPTRIVPLQSLLKPLPVVQPDSATASSSSLFPPSLRTSHLASRRASTSGILPSSLQYRTTPLLPRTQSYHHSNPIPLQTFTPALDEVAMSIQAQEDIIRKDRQSKRLLKEKSRAEGENAEPQPRIRRRSTRAGSSTEGPALGTGVLVGNLIGQDHANYVLMYNMLTGIRIGVSRCQAKVKRPLTDEDYTARHKFSFDIVGNELTPSTKYDFKFKDYAPWVFRELREYFYLDPSDYLVSLTAKYILSELGSPGKSGSFFYFSRDYRFIIKTIRHSEHKFLRSILKEYHEHIKKNPHTLLSRFYGLHRVKLPRGRKIHFVIMNNLFPPHRDIHETYDLKGSAIGRLYPEDLAATNPTAILKDLNWVGRHRYLFLGPEKKLLFEEQLRRDTELMQKLRIMDYSLLTGIHNVVRGNVDNLRDGMLTVFQPDAVKMHRRPTQIKRDEDASAVRKAVQRSDPKALSDANALPLHDSSERRLFLFYQDEGGIRGTGEEDEDLGVIYYLGIIDILTPYTFIKRVENLFKGFQYDRHMISAVPPVEYGDRFMAFIYSIIKGNDESKRPRMYLDDPPEPKNAVATTSKTPTKEIKQE